MFQDLLKINIKNQKNLEFSIKIKYKKLIENNIYIYIYY